MRKFGILVTTEQKARGVLLNVPTVDTSQADLTATEAVTLFKNEIERVIESIDALGRREPTDDVLKTFFFINVIIDGANKAAPDDVFVLALQPSKAELLSLSENDAEALIHRFNRRDA